MATAPPPECATPAPLDFSPPSFELIPDIACKEDLVEQSRNKNKRKKFNYEQVEPRALKFSPQRQEEAKIRFPAKAKAYDTSIGPHVKCPWDHNQLPMRRDFNAAQSFYKWVTDPMNSNDRYQLYSNIWAHQWQVLGTTELCCDVFQEPLDCAWHTKNIKVGWQPYRTWIQRDNWFFRANMRRPGSLVQTGRQNAANTETRSTVEAHARNGFLGKLIA